MGASAGNICPGNEEQSRGSMAPAAPGLTGGCSFSTLSGLSGRKLGGSLPRDEIPTEQKTKNPIKSEGFQIQRETSLRSTNLQQLTGRYRDEASRCLRTAQPVLRHALVQAIILRAHVGDAQRPRGEAVAGGLSEGSGIVEPRH